MGKKSWDSLPRRYIVAEPPLSADIGKYRFNCMWWGKVTPQSWGNNVHAHAGMEIHLIESGAGIYEADGERFQVCEGDLVMARSLVPHRLLGAGRTALGISFLSYEVESSRPGMRNTDPEINGLLDGFLHSRRHVIPGGGRGAIGSILGMIGRELMEPGGGSGEFVRHLGVPLIISLARACVGVVPGEGNTIISGAWFNRSPQNDAEALLHYALGVMEYRLGDDLKIGNVAAEVGISTRTLQRVFQKGQKKGMSFRKYLTTLRLAAACDILRDTSRPISQIAIDVGLSRYDHFTQAFKKRYGITPSMYRAQAQGRHHPRGVA